MSLFGYAPALLPACRRLASNRLRNQIPPETKATIVGSLSPAAMQTGAIHAIEEVEQWLADNNLKIVKEDPCVSQLPEPVEPSEGT